MTDSSSFPSPASQPSRVVRGTSTTAADFFLRLMRATGTLRRSVYSLLGRSDRELVFGFGAVEVGATDCLVDPGAFGLVGDRYSLTKMRTCLDCGFLTIQGRELSHPERIMLGTQGTLAVMPAHPEQTRCFKKLWDYEIHYSEDTFEGVCEELGRPRGECPGFAAYEAGFTPAKHLESPVERRSEKTRWRIAKLGFLAAVAGAIVLAIIKWLVEGNSK